MSKNSFILILLLVIAGLFTWLNFAEFKTDQKEKMHKDQVDSIQKINNKLIDQKQDLKEEVLVLEMQQEDLEKLADSLSQEASKPIPCRHKVQIQEKEIGALRGALNKCKEVKTVQHTTIGICDSLIVNHELILINKDEMIAINKRGKKKSFFKGLGIGGAGGILLTLLILL